MSKETIRKNAGVVVKEIRKRLGMSQKEFADKLNTSQTYLSSIESGAFPPGKFIQKVSETFNFPIEAIVFLSLSEDDIPEDRIGLYNAMRKPLEEIVYSMYIPEQTEL